MNGVQWSEHAAVPLYDNSLCRIEDAVGVAYFLDESIGISYGNANNCQVVRERATFVINSSTIGINNQSTMIEYVLSQATDSVYFTSGQIYTIKISSCFDTLIANQAPIDLINLTITAGDNIRMLETKTVYGNFLDKPYYWKKSDFDLSNDYGYANRHDTYYGVSTIL